MVSTSAGTAVTVRYKEMAMPIESKPQPTLAEDAGIFSLKGFIGQ